MEQRADSDPSFWGAMALPWKEELLPNSLKGHSLRDHMLEPTHRLLLHAFVGLIFVFNLTQIS